MLLCRMRPKQALIESPVDHCYLHHGLRMAKYTHPFFTGYPPVNAIPQTTEHPKARHEIEVLQTFALIVHIFDFKSFD